MIELPQALVGAIDRQVQAVDPRRLTRLAEELSQRYREGGTGRFVHDREEALAYAAHRLPATHAQVLAAFAMVPLRAPEFAPTSMLDIGAGPGTALWAATHVWPGLTQATCIEREAAFVDLGRALASASTHPALSGAKWLRSDVMSDGLPAGEHELVVIAHALSELSERRRHDTLRAAWERCTGVLVIVEPGTPAGFAVVRAARTELLRHAAHALAPCPHDAACPMPESNWCHFPQRHARPAIQRRVKGASLPWEDAKYSFAVMARWRSAAVPFARVIGHPRHGKGHVELDLCISEGLFQQTVSRRAGEAFRHAKDLEWGSAVENEESLGPSGGAPVPRTGAGLSRRVGGDGPPQAGSRGD